MKYRLQNTKMKKRNFHTKYTILKNRIAWITAPQCPDAMNAFMKDWNVKYKIQKKVLENIEMQNTEHWNTDYKIQNEEKKCSYKIYNIEKQNTK